MSDRTIPVSGLSAKQCAFEVVFPKFPGYLHGHVQLCGMDMHVQAYRMDVRKGKRSEPHSTVPAECRGDLDRIYELNGTERVGTLVALPGRRGWWLLVALPFA
jgi:hypothetical protein